MRHLRPNSTHAFVAHYTLCTCQGLFRDVLPQVSLVATQISLAFNAFQNQSFLSAIEILVGVINNNLQSHFKILNIKTGEQALLMLKRALWCVLGSSTVDANGLRRR